MITQINERSEMHVYHVCWYKHFLRKKQTLNIKTKHIKQFHSSKTHLTENSVMIHCIHHTRRGCWVFWITRFILLQKWWLEWG